MRRHFVKSFIKIHPCYAPMSQQGNQVLALDNFVIEAYASINGISNELSKFIND